MTRLDVPAEITVYTLPVCVHCARAKALLRRRGLPFHEVDVSRVPDFRRQLAGLTGGVTVPQIVIDGEPIGGANRLARLDRLGVLGAIAEGEEFPIVRDGRRVSPRSLARSVAALVRGHDGVSAITRVRVRIDRAGRVVDAHNATEPEPAEEEHDGEGMRRTAS